jgi:hypothetical protein
MEYSTNIGRELRGALISNGNRCWVCPREKVGINDSERSSDENTFSTYLKIISDNGPMDSVIFDIINDVPAKFDLFDYRLFVNMIEHTITDFFNTLQLVTQHMLTSKGAIWVLTREDSLEYHLPAIINPIIAHSQNSLVKCVAKEVARFGITINAAMLQLSAQDVHGQTWKEANGLKAYSSRFKPLTSKSVAALLATLIDLPEVPMNGSMLNIGLGTSEYNI